MKTKIRSITIFTDEIQVYRGTKCKIYPCAWNNKRKMRLIDVIWDSGRVRSVKESRYVPSWDITYEIK